MWGIWAINRGMWGYATWCKKNGEIELYRTMQEAQKVVDQRNSKRPLVNNFTQYFAMKYEED